MTYEMYRYVFIFGAALAVLCLVTALILFFVLKIPKVIGDLTGATARKAIEKIRTQNEGAGERTYQSSAVNLERGRVTDRISPSGRVMRVGSGRVGAAMATSKISTQRLEEDAQQSYETTLLEAQTAEETTLLPQSGAEETTLLHSNGIDETTLLYSGDPSTGAPLIQESGNVFAVEYEITLIHSDEQIA